MRDSLSQEKNEQGRPIITSDAGDTICIDPNAPCQTDLKLEEFDPITRKRQRRQGDLIGFRFYVQEVIRKCNMEEHTGLDVGQLSSYLTGSMENLIKMKNESNY